MGIETEKRLLQIFKTLKSKGGIEREFPGYLTSFCRKHTLLWVFFWALSTFWSKFAEMLKTPKKEIKMRFSEKRREI